MSAQLPSTHQAERALHDSEIRLQQVLDNSSAIVFAKDSRGRYLFVNREFERVTGLSASRTLGQTDEQIFAPDLAARFRHNDLRVLQERQSFEFEETADFGNGTRTFMSSKFPLLDSDGAAYAVCGMATDITERKHREQAFSTAALAVSQSEEETLYRQLARYLATILDVDCAFIATTSGDESPMRMLAFYLDGDVRENFSYPLTGTPCATVVGQQYRLYPSRLAELFPIDAAFRELGLDCYAGQPLSDSNGKPLGLIAVVSRRRFLDPALVEATLRIFAVRVNAELERASGAAALRASEAQYRAIFNASDDALVLWNSRSERVDVNPAYERMYGYVRDEVLAGERARGLSDGHRKQQAEIINRTLAGERYQGEIETVRRNGERFPIEVRTIPILHRGEPHVLAMIRDLTERRRVEHDRAQLEAQLRQAQKMEAIGQLTGGIAHDFNNLLTSIMGYVALASDSEPAARDRRLAAYLDHAQRSCERARDLIQQMLMFSRGQRGSPRLASLATVVPGALATVRAGLPGTVELAVEIDDTVQPVVVDPTQIEQVLLNLCINARDATGGTGRVGVVVRPLPTANLVCTGCRKSVRGDFVELVVEDNGHGMSPNVIERIFEPFFSTKEPGKGSGMGLSMVHGIVHEHGGHIVVESTPGQGAKFRVVLPVASDAAANAPCEKPHEAQSRSARPKLEGSVLVVDDEESVGEFMRELLGTWGLRAVFVPRPEEALDLVQADPLQFDVVITDQSMPRITGLVLARRLREIRADLPVILYTGHGEALAEFEIDASRLCAVMRKPIDPALLNQTLARCLATARSW